jgi:hypothetical protein
MPALRCLAGFQLALAHRGLLGIDGVLMKDKAKAELLGRRGELLAELFLQELGAVFVARPTGDLGYDFFVGFNNSEGGVNIAAVEVKATERPVHAHFPVQKRLFRRLAKSNVPVLLLVVNVKDNRLFYAVTGSYPIGDDAEANTVSIPVTAVDETTRDELRDLLANSHAAAA